MTSVSHPLIADLAPSRSTTRPDAPARDPRREDEKFSVPEATPVEPARREIPDTPVAPVTPVAPIKTRTDHTLDAPNGSAQVSTAAAVAALDPETGTLPLSGETKTPPAHTAVSSVGLNAGIAGINAGIAGSPASAPPAPVVTAATPVVGNQNSPAAATAPTAAPGPTAAQSADAQSAATTTNTQQQQTGVATNTGQTAQPIIQASASGSASGPLGAQTAQAAQQAAANLHIGRTTSGGTTPSSASATKPTAPTGKNGAVDPLAGEAEVVGNGIKKPATDFATSVSTAFGTSDTAAKPGMTQASAQIMAQAMANAPSIAAATPEPISPSLTAPASVTGDALGVSQSFNAEMRAAIDAPTQAAAYTARGAVTAQPAAEQIAMQITRAADQNIDRMTVHLKPAELGKVTIDLEVGPDNRLLAVISAERSETLDLLQRDSKSLEKALNDAGIKTDSGSLEFNLKGEGGTAENGRDGDGKLHDGAIMLPGDIDAAEINNIPTNTPLILPEGRIDIQV